MQFKNIGQEGIIANTKIKQVKKPKHI